MARQSQSEIDLMIQRSAYSNRDLVRRDIIQVIQSSQCNLILNLVPYYSPEKIYREYLSLHGTILCQYRDNKYNIPIEITVHFNHPFQAPAVQVKPTSNMYVSTSNADVQADGTVLNQYLRAWRHPHSDLCSLINSLSQSFSQCPPVYASSNAVSRPTPYPVSTNDVIPSPSLVQTTLPYPTNVNQRTPYPIDNSAMPTPMFLPGSSFGALGNSISSSGDVYRDSLRSAVEERVRSRMQELSRVQNDEINSLKKAEEELNQGEGQINLLLNQIEKQQRLIETYLTFLTNRTSERSSPKDATLVKEDAIRIRSSFFQQLFDNYLEDHAMDDLFYYLADGLRKGAIPLEIYLKHIGKLSRKQFFCRALMIKCREMCD